MSDEEKEILNNLKEYMQNNIDKGNHKFFYNDLGWDFKCIDCLNTIDKVLKQSKEIEELKDFNTKLQATKDRLDSYDKENTLEIEKLKKEIEELKNADLTTVYLDGVYDGEKEVEDKIKTKIEEYDDKGMTVNLANRSAGKTFQQAVHYEVKKVLQELLEKE